MNALTNNAIPTVIGTPFEGGFYVGQFQIGGERFALIRAPKALGFHDPIHWGKRGLLIPGATSFVDGLANTRAMAEAGSELGAWALDLSIGGHNDWYLGARDENELVYRACKPTAQENWCSFRDGDNPSSLPPGYPYTDQAPGQSPIAIFQEGGEEALEARSYWTSTQDGPISAWIQHFDDGLQGFGVKVNARPAFAVRRIKVTP
ncbi:DUF1566 domain-containing protein [Pseudomonas nitroreducens]|uniref:DUF1566 domain-containing protein n=1 Tax=Pseudomonas nitroreducens TaxID=46680 RepID=UPI0026585070|nr:DUF1566 domain-containing protein [Pseudomonas nitroreducens]MCP1646959.1 hypothetical protein [Pseudomonas nitroreducens]MCP1685535.1 hypothetical protein [Pseudomonas nitroreducens]